MKMLVPDEIAAHHDDYINRYLTTREAQFMGRFREVQVNY